MGKFIITEEEKKQIRGMYLLIEEENTITGKITLIKSVPNNQDGAGFFSIRINPDGDISSVVNKWDGGQVESKKVGLTSGEPMENNTIGAVYYFKGTPNKKFTINITGPNGNMELTAEESEIWQAYLFHFTNLTYGVYTITASNSPKDSLTITVSQPVNCDNEWKTIYNDLEMSNNEGIDKGPYYCTWANGQKSIDYIKGKIPDIDVRKIKCLKNKIKSQYC